MSGAGTIDLDWSALTPQLDTRVSELLNSALSNATRPSFIGPISVSSFEFGSSAPDVAIIDIRDIYPDFLEDDNEDDENADQTSEEIRAAAERARMMEEYEWVSRREGVSSDLMFDENASNFSSPPFGTPPNIARPRYMEQRTVDRPGRAETSPHPHEPHHHHAPNHIQRHDAHSYPSSSLDSPQSSSPASSPPPMQSKTSETDLQLHFRIAFESNMRISINTSLQINYPSPMIMALPIKLRLTGLVLDGELVVAYEGSRKRIHICFLDDQANYNGGPIPASKSRYEDEEDAAPMGASIDERDPAAIRTSATIPRFSSKPSQAAPLGGRLLPTIVLESEIGQEDKHVLRNVARVERFIQDVIRKTIEEELVFPNFQTIVLPDSNE